jgi:hypothetical protein
MDLDFPQYSEKIPCLRFHTYWNTVRWTDFKDDWDSSFQRILKDDGNNLFDVIFIWIDNFHRIFVFVRTGGQISKLIGTIAFNKFLKMMGTIDSK